MLLLLRISYCPRVISLNISFCVINAEGKLVVTEASIFPGTLPRIHFPLGFFLTKSKYLILAFYPMNRLSFLNRQKKNKVQISSVFSFIEAYY